MLEEPQFAARPQDPLDLGERPGQIPYGAQDQRRHRPVERLALDRQRLGRPRHHVHRHLGAQGGPDRELPQRAFRLQRHDLRDGAGVVGEVQPVSRTDLDDPAGEPRQQLLAVRGDAAPQIGGHAEAGVEAGEDRMMHGVPGSFLLRNCMTDLRYGAGVRLLGPVRPDRPWKNSPRIASG